MSEEMIDQVTKDLWMRAKQIFLATLNSVEEKNQAERHLNSLIASVTREGDTFAILTSNDYAADLIRGYAAKLKSSFTLAGAPESLAIDIRVDASVQPTVVIPPKPSRRATKPAEHMSEFVSTMPLNSDYTFEEFVRGPSNSYVYAAAKGVVASPGKKGYNPMFIYGGTGLGKTHIMQAIGNAIIKANPHAAVCYLTTERFLNEYVNTMTTGKNIQEFRDRYRKIDVLLVDDIQFLTHGKNFQEEFFNTFNALTSEGKQVVMTSDVAPKDLPIIDDRLISRFQSGMVQEIEQPSYETRLAILKKKAESFQTPIAENILTFIAQNIKSHVRALEGALAKVSVYLSTEPGIVLDDEFLEHILKDLIEREKSRKKLTIEEVQTCVSKKYGVSIGQILSPERTASLVTPRQLAMYIARKFTMKSLPEIAAKFEKKHATIIHGIKTIEKRMEVEPDLKQTMEEILNELGCSLSDKME